MIVSFYATQPKKTILITESWAQMYVGFQFQHENKTYQVTSLQWIDREAGKIKALCIELPVSGTHPEK